jgi:hypothetical protein
MIQRGIVINQSSPLAMPPIARNRHVACQAFQRLWLRKDWRRLLRLSRETETIAVMAHLFNNSIHAQFCQLVECQRIHQSLLLSYAE